MRFLFTAGGTGGHLTPAIAVADQIRRLAPSSSVLFLTGGRPVDEKFLAGTPYGQVPLFKGDRAPQKTELGAWIRAFARARVAIRDFEPDVVVGFGGYPTAGGAGAALGSIPAAVSRMLARRPLGTRLPLILLEQNAHVGLAVKALAPCARVVLLSMAAAEAELPDRVPREVIGNPLPGSFVAGPTGNGVAKERPHPDPREFGLEPDRPTLVVLGGSQGARGVNQMVLSARSRLADRIPGLQIVIVAGDGEVATVRRAVAEAPVPATVVTAFETRMRELYELADVVVARAGGTTLAETAIIGRPMVLVPYPHHKDQHQLANAQVFERVGAARIVEEGEGAAERFLEAVLPWLSDRASRQRAGDSARTLGRPSAAKDAADRVLEIARERSR